MAPDASLETNRRPAVGIERPRTGQVHHEIERQILCDRIEELERKLREERRQRQQIVEQYERLLTERGSKPSDEADGGLLERLF